MHTSIFYSFSSVLWVCLYYSFVFVCCSFLPSRLTSSGALGAPRAAHPARSRRTWPLTAAPRLALHGSRCHGPTNWPRTRPPGRNSATLVKTTSRTRGCCVWRWKLTLDPEDPSRTNMLLLICLKHLICSFDTRSIYVLKKKNYQTNNLTLKGRNHQLGIISLTLHYGQKIFI